MGWHDMPTAVPSHWEFPFSNNQALLNDLDTSINVLNELSAPAPARAHRAACAEHSQNVTQAREQ